MRDVFLHGDLGAKFGEHHRIDVHTIGGLCWAMEARAGGFLQEIRKGSYLIYHGENSLGDSDLPIVFRDKAPFSIVPAVEGSGGGGGKAIGTVVLGLAIVATAGFGAVGAIPGGAIFGAAGTGAWMTWGSLALFGGVLALGGVSQLIAQTPQTAYDARDSADDRKSFLFNGAVNSIEQGTVLPIVLGRHMVGSTVVSGGILSKKIQGGTTDDTIPPTPDATQFTVSIGTWNQWTDGDATAYISLTQTVGDHLVDIGNSFTVEISSGALYYGAIVYLNGDLYGQAYYGGTAVSVTVTTTSQIMVVCRYDNW
jgi:predicted phage tail protein